MDDLISRQAAIDALLGITAMRNTIPLDSAIFNIKKLPSAQPDLSEYSDKLWRNAYERGKEEARIQKMQDLEQAEIQKAYELGKLDAMEEMPHWISLEDKIPDNNADVLLQFKSNMGVGFHEDGDWAINTGDGIYSAIGYNEEKPIAWMPLPEPYNGGDEDGKKYNG